MMAMGTYGPPDRAQPYTRFPSIHRTTEQQRNAAPQGSSGWMGGTTGRRPTSADLRVQSLRPNVDPGVVVLGGGLGNFGDLMTVVGVRPNSHERRAPTDRRAEQAARSPAERPELAFGVVGSGVTVLGKRPAVRMTGAALPGGGGPARWSRHTAHSAKSPGAPKHGRSSTVVARGSVTGGPELPPETSEDARTISGVASPVHSAPAALLATDDAPRLEPTATGQAVTLAGRTNAMLAPTRATRCSTAERKDGANGKRASGRDSSILERSDGSAEEGLEGDEPAEGDVEDESEGGEDEDEDEDEGGGEGDEETGDEDAGDEDEDEDAGDEGEVDEDPQQLQSSSDTEVAGKHGAESLFLIDPNGCCQSAIEMASTSTAAGDHDVSEPPPAAKKNKNLDKSKRRKKTRRTQKRRKVQTVVNARLREFSSRVAKAVQAVADSRASAAIDGDTADVRPWRQCMATPKPVAGESQEDERAKDNVPQLSEEEKSAVRAAAVEAAKMRVKLARKKRGEEPDDDEPKRSSSLAPTSAEATATLRANTVRIASKARISRAVESRSAQSVDSSQRALERSAISELHKLARNRESSQSLSLVGTVAHSSESPLRRRTASLRPKRFFTTVSEEIGRSVEVMSPKTLEKFQKEQQEKAKARIRERKIQVEEDGRKQAEAEDQARAASKTHHLEIQEAKAQRRAELYMLNVILRRKEFRGFELYMARHADCLPVTSGSQAKPPAAEGTAQPDAEAQPKSAPDTRAEPASDAEPQLAPQPEPEPGPETERQAQLETSEAEHLKPPAVEEIIAESRQAVGTDATESAVEDVPKVEMEEAARQEAGAEEASAVQLSET